MEKNDEFQDDEVEIEIEVENDDVEDQEGEGEDDGSSESEDWQIVDGKPENNGGNENAVSKEQLERDEEALGRDRDDAMAEEFDESRRYIIYIIITL